MPATKSKPRIFRFTEDEISEGSLGVCLSCGETADGVEPDAREYECESCEKPTVYGLEEALMMGRVEIK